MEFIKPSEIDFNEYQVYNNKSNYFINKINADIMYIFSLNDNEFNILCREILFEDLIENLINPKSIDIIYEKLPINLLEPVMSKYNLNVSIKSLNDLKKNNYSKYLDVVNELSFIVINSSNLDKKSLVNNLLKEDIKKLFTLQTNETFKDNIKLKIKIYGFYKMKPFLEIYNISDKKKNIGIF